MLAPWPSPARAGAVFLPHQLAVRSDEPGCRCKTWTNRAASVCNRVANAIILDKISLCIQHKSAAKLVQIEP